MGIRNPGFQLAAFLLVLTALAFSDPASADARRFMPLAKSALQRIDVLNGRPIVSASAKGFVAGATLAPISTVKTRLLVSIKNTGAAPIYIPDGGVSVTAGGAPLALSRVDAEGKPEPKLDARTARQVLPNELLASQYIVELPKPAKDEMVSLVISVTVAGETLVFEFRELE